MSQSGLPAFDSTVQTTNVWLNETAEQMRWSDRRHAYDAAIIYFKDIIATFPGAKEIPDALLRLVDSYNAIGYAAEMREACDNLRHYYPKTPGLDHHCPPSLTAPSSAPPAAADAGFDSTAHTQ